jgi:hypothetical protein
MSALPQYDMYGRLIYQGPLGTNVTGRPVTKPQEDIGSVFTNYVLTELIGGGLKTIFGGKSSEQGQSTAIEQGSQAPKETAGSGEISMPPYAGSTYFPTMEAGLPSIIGGGLQLAQKFLPQIIGGAAVTAAAPVVMDAFTGQPKKLRVTKKLKSQVRQAVNLMGIEGTAQAMGVDVNTVLYILMKKMRNDGPYVTKAAVRKTRQTIRKLDTLCDLKDEMCPPKRATARRRTTTARTRVTNIKN